jgi:hypothetical protein
LQVGKSGEKWSEHMEKIAGIEKYRVKNKTERKRSRKTNIKYIVNRKKVQNMEKEGRRMDA